MSVDERVLEVIDALYVAAMDETLWPDALRKLTDLTGSHGWHHSLSDLRFRLVDQICPAPSAQAGVGADYEAADVEQIAFLHRHLERALMIGFRLGSLGTLQRCIAEMLDRNPAAIVLLDEHGRVVYCNRAAEKLREAEDGVRLATRGISLTSKRDNDKLQRLITQAVSATDIDNMSGGAMQAMRFSDRPPFSILVSPMSRRYPMLSTVRPAVCVAISDPAQHQPLAIQRLRAVFELTEAEARLALLLATGEGLRAAAAKLGIGYGTARVRLSEIFRKTDTHRQGELVRRLATTLALG